MAEYPPKTTTKRMGNPRRCTLPPLDSTRKRVRFSDFEVDLDSCELRRRGVRLKVQIQPFQVLRALLERPGQVVTREELQKKIWPGHTFGDFDQGLNNAVKRLREVLGGDAEKPVFIETLPKRGYRFNGSIQEDRYKSLNDAETPADEFAEHRGEAENNAEAIVRSRGFVLGVATGVLFSLFAMAGFLVHNYSGQIGDFLIQLGTRLQAKSAMPVVTSTPAPIPIAHPETKPQQHLVRALISVPLLEKPSFPPFFAGAERQDAEQAPGLLASETSPLLASLSLPPNGLNLPSPVDAMEIAPPEVLADGARATRDEVPPYVNSSAGKYFDVVKYRDALRANQVMDELAKQGFYGTIVHNRTLWLNSYHIMVGPYINEEDVEAARPGLESRGFSPRVLPSKSTRVSLPPMTLYGTDVTIRDCIVSWEINSPEATVKFVKGRKVVATVKGRWEKRDVPYKWNAVVHLDDQRGPQTLLELQWRYTDKVLILDGSPFKFYFSPS
jgi:DNA-binding winged helix-turn-helix (wHTH) protein